MQWSPVSKAELPAYLKKAAALLAVATVLGGCSGQPSDSEPTQTALAGEVETTAHQNCCNWLGRLMFLNRILR